MQTVTRLALASEVDDAAEVLGDAFADYPWTRWTVDGTDHHGRIVALQRIALQRFALPFGAISVTFVDGEMQSVAAWSDSAAVASGDVDVGHEAQVAELEGARHAASRAADGQLEPLRPRHRHLYLGTVGTTRRAQGRGLGVRTLGPLIEASESAALEIWLETSSESNVRFYRRFGFEVEEHIVIDGGGPDVWLMARRRA